MEIALGDPHNFGSKVTQISKDLIFKPRPLTWEKIFLSEESEFRLFFDVIQKRILSKTHGSLFPNLDIVASDDFNGGTVEFLRLERIRGINEEILKKAGMLIALCSFFGIGDLHSENVFIGKNSAGVLICSPIDIESIFSLCRIPSQTLLIPSNEIDFQQCGLSDIFKFLPENPQERLFLISILLSSYLELLMELKKEKNVVQSILKEAIPSSIIRVILRNTQVYSDYIKYGTNPGFEEYEMEQLQRGDIPYFFRTFGCSHIKWFKHKDQMKSLNGDIVSPIWLHQDSRLIIEKSLNQSHPSFDEMLYAGSLQIVKNLMPKAEEEIEVLNEKIIIKISKSEIQIRYIAEEWSCDL